MNLLFCDAWSSLSPSSGHLPCFSLLSNTLHPLARGSFLLSSGTSPLPPLLLTCSSITMIATTYTYIIYLSVACLLDHELPWGMEFARLGYSSAPVPRTGSGKKKYEQSEWKNEWMSEWNLGKWSCLLLQGKMAPMPQTLPDTSVPGLALFCIGSQPSDLLCYSFTFYLPY